jgi:hypothetical protein
MNHQRVPNITVMDKSLLPTAGATNDDLVTTLAGSLVNSGDPTNATGVGAPRMPDTWMIGSEVPVPTRTPQTSPPASPRPTSSVISMCNSEGIQVQSNSSSDTEGSVHRGGKRSAFHVISVSSSVALHSIEHRTFQRNLFFVYAMSVMDFVFLQR